MWLRSAQDLTLRLATETSPERLPEAILTLAVELSEAERGVLIGVEGCSGDFRLKLLASRGFGRWSRSNPECQVPRVVIEKALQASDQSVVSTRPNDVDLIDYTSVAGRGIQSFVAVPMPFRGEVTGVLYLDHRDRGELFSEADLPLLHTFAAQAALALRLPRPQPGPVQSGLLVGSSPAAKSLASALRNLARSSGPILVTGEPGAEFGLIVRELHAQGQPAGTPFRQLSCAREDPRLSGSGRGGALSRPGTLCLSEVEALTLADQALLFEALATGRCPSVFNDLDAVCQARVLATTTCSLEERVEAGGFRRDLFHLLDARRLAIPPLRSRVEDIPALIESIAARAGRSLPPLGASAIPYLERYTWPGNMSELESEVQGLLRVRAPKITSTDLSRKVREGRGLSAGGVGKTLGDLEAELVSRTLRECDWVKAHAARRLGIPRSTLYGLMEKHGISEEQAKEEGES